MPQRDPKKQLLARFAKHREQIQALRAIPQTDPKYSEAQALLTAVQAAFQRDREQFQELVDTQAAAEKAIAEFEGKQAEDLGITGAARLGFASGLAGVAGAMLPGMLAAARGVPLGPAGMLGSLGAGMLMGSAAAGAVPAAAVTGAALVPGGATGLEAAQQILTTIQQHPIATVVGGAIPAAASLVGSGVAQVRRIANLKEQNLALQVRAQRARTLAAEETAVARARAKTAADEAQAAIKRLEQADTERRLGHPQRPATVNARHAALQADARRRIAEAKRAEFEAVVAERKALGELSPLEQARLQQIAKSLEQQDLRILMLKQQADAGTLKPKTAQVLLARLERSIPLLEAQTKKAAASASVAGEEAMLRVTRLREELKIVQETLRQMGILPEPLPGSTLGTTRAALSP